MANKYFQWDISLFVLYGESQQRESLFFTCNSAMLVVEYKRIFYQCYCWFPADVGKQHCLVNLKRTVARIELCLYVFIWTVKRVNELCFYLNDIQMLYLFFTVFISIYAVYHYLVFSTNHKHLLTQLSYNWFIPFFIIAT